MHPHQAQAGEGSVQAQEGSVSQHALRQIPPPQSRPPQQTATAADGTHPTGMHSSCSNVSENGPNQVVQRLT